MKMKREQVYELYMALSRMGDVSVMKTAYAIAKTMSSIRTEAEFFENQRNRLLKKYGKEEKGNLSISMDNPNWKDFAREYAELASEEIEVEIHQVDATMEDFMAEGVKAKDYSLVMMYLVLPPSADESKN